MTYSRSVVGGEPVLFVQPSDLGDVRPAPIDGPLLASHQNGPADAVHRDAYDDRREADTDEAKAQAGPGLREIGQGECAEREQQERDVDTTENHERVEGVSRLMIWAVNMSHVGLLGLST
jgi:hypothetical protein